MYKFLFEKLHSQNKIITMCFSLVFSIIARFIFYFKQIRHESCFKKIGMQKYNICNQKTLKIQFF
jgi:hypothetical protein